MGMHVHLANAFPAEMRTYYRANLWQTVAELEKLLFYKFPMEN